jgi:hypothetical protein
MSSYLTVSDFRLLSLMPGEFVDTLETRYPGFVAGQITIVSDWIDSRLRKRYVAPFGAPVPDVIRGWCARLVTPRVWHRRGVDPTDAQWTLVKEDADAASAEVLEAANSETGLFDLPLRSDTTPGVDAITQGGPFAYSEQSPYSWTDLQGLAGRQEDQNRTGGSSR